MVPLIWGNSRIKGGGPYSIPVTDTIHPWLHVAGGDFEVENV